MLRKSAATLAVMTSSCLLRGPHQVPQTDLYLRSKLLVMCREYVHTRTTAFGVCGVSQGRKFYRALNGGGRTPSSPPSPLWKQASTALRVVYLTGMYRTSRTAFSTELLYRVRSRYVATNHTAGSISLPIVGLKLQHHAAVRKFPDTDAPCLAMESPGSSGNTRL